MLRTAAALLLLGLPCFAETPAPINQIIPGLPEGEGTFSTVTILNSCSTSQDLTAGFITEKGEALRRGTLLLLPGRSWTGTFNEDVTPMKTYYAAISQTNKDGCAVTMTAEENVIQGDHLATLTMPAIRIDDADIKPGDFAKTAPDVFLVNLSNDPGRFSICEQPSAHGTVCLSWSEHTLAPLNMILLKEHIRIFRKSTMYLFSINVLASDGQRKTFSSDSSITFGISH